MLPGLLDKFEGATLCHMEMGREAAKEKGTIRKGTCTQRNKNEKLACMSQGTYATMFPKRVTDAKAVHIHAQINSGKAVKEQT